MSNVVNLAEKRFAREKIRIAFATVVREAYSLCLDDSDGTPFSELMREMSADFSDYDPEMLASEYWRGVALVVAEERGIDTIDQTFSKSFDVGAHHEKALAWADDFLDRLPALYGGGRA